MWKWLLRWEYANCSQGWIYNLPCPLYRLSIVYITEIDCSWSSCTENKWNLNWTQHTHKYKRDKQFTQIHNWPAQLIREFSKCNFLLTPTKYHFLKACHWWLVVMRSLRCQECVTVPSVLTNYLHSVLYHFPSNAAAPHFSCLETICKYETEKRRKSGDWRICFVFALYLHYRLRNDSLIRSVVHVFIVITRRLWHS